MYFKTYLHVLNFRFHRGSVCGVYVGVTKIITPRSQASVKLAKYASNSNVLQS